MPWTCAGLRLLLLVAGAAVGPEDRKPVVPVYTNDDLDRVSPHKDETGVASSVTVPPVPVSTARGADGLRRRSEEYWRAEAERVHERQRALRDRIELLRARIEERESRRPGRPRSRASSEGTATQLETWRRELAMLEGRLHDAEARFEDRARREGALPGWLR